MVRLQARGDGRACPILRRGAHRIASRLVPLGATGLLAAAVAGLVFPLPPAGASGRTRPVVGRGLAAPGLLPDGVSAVGDSVMVDYTDLLRRDLPGIDVHAAVGLQFGAGVAELARLRSAGRLGATVVVALGTNGPITPASMDALFSTLAGAARVVLVSDYVDRPWQETNDRLIAEAAATHAHVAVANWAARARRHPAWLYGDGVHLPLDGPGARELAWIIRQAVRRP